MSFGKQAIHAILWNTCGNYIGFGINFISQLLLARLLMPEDFGLFTLAISIFEILSLLTSWSFPLAIIQIPEEEDLIDTAFWLSLLEGIIVLIITAIISLGLNTFYPNHKNLPLVFFIIGLGRVISFINGIYIACLEKNLKYEKLTLVKTIISVITIVFALIFAIMGFGIWSLVIRELMIVFLSFIGFKYISGWKFTWKYNQQLSKKIISFSSKMLLSRSLESIFYRLDSFLIGIFGGVNMLGYYSQARYLVDVSNTISSSGSAVAALPVFSKIQHDEIKLKEASSLLNYFLIRLMLPFSLIFMLFPYEIVVLLYGEKWRNAGLSLLCIGLYATLVPLFENLKSLLYGVGKVEVIAYIRIIQISIATPLIIFGIQSFGIVGSSIGFMISILVGVCVIYIVMLKYTLGSIKKNILVPVTSGIISWVCVFCLKRYVFYDLAGLQFLLLVIVTLGIYFMLLFLLEHELLIKNLQRIYSKLK